MSSKIGKIEHNFVLVAAIDFGTTYSGYAFSFKSEPDNIKMNKNWGEGMAFQSYKTPTSVLVDDNLQFVAFGFEADQKYSEVIQAEGEEGSAPTYHMFRQFKMLLHATGVTRNKCIQSVDGTECQALEIFAMSLRYLKDHLLATLAQQTAKPNARFIKWVITVPAIWRDNAKQFMREAAYQASLITSKDSKNLEIALEPEAASMFCRTIKVDDFVPGSQVTTSGFKEGVKYLVIDAGGGTIDITAHQVLADRRVKEIYSANGGPWGGTKVDKQFVKLLKDVFGESFIERYQQQCPLQFLEIMLKFELAKRSVHPDKEGKIMIPLSWNFGQHFSTFTGKGLQEAIMESSSLGVAFKDGTFIIKWEAVLKMFSSVIHDTVKHLTTLLTKPALTDCQYFLLVGGFGQCTFLQKSIRDRFEPQVKVVIPLEAQMSVINGAVMFGHCPSNIKSRLSKRTYGDKIIVPFIPGVHDPAQKIIFQPKCRNVFNPYVQVEEEVETGKTHCFSVKAHDATQTSMLTEIYAMDHKVAENIPEYVNQPGCEKVGQFSVSMPDTSKGSDRYVQFEVMFGGTEITVRAVDEETGSEAQTTIDFLTC